MSNLAQDSMSAQQSSHSVDVKHVIDVASPGARPLTSWYEQPLLQGSVPQCSVPDHARADQYSSIEYEAHKEPPCSAGSQACQSDAPIGALLHALHVSAL